MVAFYLNCLPENILQIILRSTKYDWDKREIQNSFGYDCFLENKDLFHTLQLVAINKKLLKINKAFLSIIAINRFMKVNAAGIKAGRILLKTVAVKNIQKVAATIGVKQALKYLSLNFQQYSKLKRNISCVSSIFNLCKIKHPSQLLQKEIEAIKTYCLEPCSESSSLSKPFRSACIFLGS